MLSSLRSFISGVALFGAVLMAPPVSAQAPFRVTNTPAELLAAYVRERQAPDGQHGASMAVTHVLTHHTEYAPADVESLLDGLEELALTSPAPRLRAEAAFSLSIPGSRHSSRPIAGTFARLARVYRTSTDPLVRSVVVSAMSRLDERREAAVFLERVATQQHEDFAGVAGSAMASLVMLGDEGRAALKRMHERGTVRDPEAKAGLATLAKNGYRLP